MEAREIVTLCQEIGATADACANECQHPTVTVSFKVYDARADGADVVIEGVTTDDGRDIALRVPAGTVLETGP